MKEPAAIDAYLTDLEPDRRETVRAVHDLGKSCLRFKGLEDLDVGLVAEAVAELGVDDHIALYERARRR